MTKTRAYAAARQHGKSVAAKTLLRLELLRRQALRLAMVEAVHDGMLAASFEAARECETVSARALLMGMR